MANYGFSTTIPYGTDLHEVTGIEYCAWEDALDKAGDDTNAMEWATFDTLISFGYFVSQPKVERPITEEQKAAEPKGKAKRTRKGAAAATSRIPGPVVEETDDITYDNTLTNLVTGASREPVWTQSRILTERDKLLREREKITTIKEKALAQKILEMQILKRIPVEVTSGVDILYLVTGGVFVFMVFVFLFALATANSR